MSGKQHCCTLCISPNNVRSLNGAQSYDFCSWIAGNGINWWDIFIIRDRNDRYVVQVKKYTKTYITKESGGLHNLIPWQESLVKIRRLEPALLFIRYREQGSIMGQALRGSAISDLRPDLQALRWGVVVKYLSGATGNMSRLQLRTRTMTTFDKIGSRVILSFIVREYSSDIS